MFCLIAAVSAQGNEPQHPFVIGYERFGRHEDIDDSIAGRLLVTELGCSNCHATEDPLLSAKPGPDLSSAGDRLREDWLRRYLQSPQKKKPGTTMPDRLGHLPAERQDEAIDAVVAYLSTLRAPVPEPKAGGAMPVVHRFWERGNSDRGKELYHTVGCVACHAAGDDYETSSPPPSPIDALIEQLEPEEIEELGLAAAARRVESIPHGDLPAKYSARALTMFLLDPERYRPAARMPNLRLSPGEAADIAAYLIKGNRTSDDPPADPILTGTQAPTTQSLSQGQHSQQLIDAGRRVFRQLQCVACHETGDKVQQAKLKQTNAEAPFASTNLNELSFEAESSCLQNAAASMPQYLLDSHQLAAIQAALDAGETTRSAAKTVQTRMLQLNCYGCHARSTGDDQLAMGGVGRFRKAYFESVGQVDLGDEGRLPPPLTGVGRKLRPAALAGVFDRKTEPHRPFMTIRMPAYHRDVVQPLINQFPKADRVDRTPAAEVFGPPADLAEAGRFLAGTGCVQCHLFRGEHLPGVVGIDLNGITRRVHPRWFADFVRNPGAVKKRTRMPTFFPDGKSNQPDLLDGDVDRQIAALWYYLKDLPDQPLPEKIAEVRSRNYELVPQQQAVILRTFMHEAGTHAIAVGFPQKIHYAFDAERCRLAVGWKGQFLDARGTWFERFTPPAVPLGGDEIDFPAGSLFALAESKNTSQANEQLDANPKTTTAPTFMGYRVDNENVPTLMYRLGPWKFEDRIQPISKQRLQRKLKIVGDWGDQGKHTGFVPLMFQPLGSGEVDREQDSQWVTPEGLRVSVHFDRESEHLFQQEDTLPKWVSTSPDQVPRRIVIDYQW